MAARIKKGDTVVVIAGKDKGRTGEVVRVIPAENRAVVRGVNVARRHQRQTANTQGGIIACVHNHGLGQGVCKVRDAGFGNVDADHVVPKSLQLFCYRTAEVA